MIKMNFMLKTCTYRTFHHAFTNVGRTPPYGRIKKKPAGMMGRSLLRDHHQFICHIFISNCRHISRNGRPPEKHKV